MDEIIALQAALAKAQLAETAHRVSERNAVEIVLKLIEMKKIQLIFSKSGREYLTPAQVVEEVEMELMSGGGRVTLVDLAPILNVDFNHIETAAKSLVAKKKSIIELSGELIASWYLDTLVEEINESLQESGSIAIVSLAQKFNLPAEFMRNTIEQRLGTFVQGYIEEGQLYTQSFIQMHTARTRGIFRALTKPTPLRSIIQKYGLMESRVNKEVNAMIKDGSLSGSIKGVDDRAVYTPNLFLRGQTQGVESFFSTNGFIEYKKLERLAIANPKAYLSTKFPTSLQLQSLALSENLVSSVVLSCEDAANSHLFCNAQTILPNILSRSEVEQVLEHAITSANKSVPTLADKSPALFLANEVFAVSTLFRNEAQSYAIKQLQKWIDEDDIKADAAAAAAAATPSASAASSTPAKAAAKKAAPPSSDEEEEEESNKRSSKAKGKVVDKKSKKGAESDDEDAAPAASKDKKKRRGKKGDSSDEEDEPAPVKAKGVIKPSSKAAGSTATVLTRDRVQKWLKSGWNSIVKASQAGNAEVQSGDSVNDESTEELIAALAALIHPACLKIQKERAAARAAALAAAASAAGASSASGVSTTAGGVPEAVLRRQQLESFRTAIQDQYENVVMYQHAIEYASGANSDDKDAPKSTLKELRADKSLITTLESHLSKTLVAGLIDLLIRMEAFSGLSGSQQSAIAALENTITLSTAPVPEGENPHKARFDVKRDPLTPKDRDQIINALGRRSQEALKTLLESQGKEVAFVVDRFEAAAKTLDLALKKSDKKTERSRVFALRKTLMATLSTEDKPAVVLQLAVLLLFAKVHSVVLHAPARVLSTVRTLLKPDLQPLAYAKLRRYNQLVMKSLRGDSADDASSSSSGNLASDSEDEAADEALPKEQQIKLMTLAAVNAELAAGVESIRAFGTDPSTAVKPDAKK